MKLLSQGHLMIVAFGKAPTDPFLFESNMSTMKSLLCIAFLIVHAISSTANNCYAADSLPTDEEAEKLGLVVQWRSQSQRAQTGTGKTGMVLWPSEATRETISIKVGNREVERIDANSVDRKAVEKLVLAESKNSRLPRLGMELAREQAQQIVKRYEILGRKATMEEHVESITFLVSASRDGAVECFDAETGKIMWSTSVGKANLPTYGPGINDKYVAVSNGSILYVLDTLTGKLVGQRHINESLGAAPQPINEMIYCSTLTNAVLAIRGSDVAGSEVTSARFSSGVPSPVVVSNNKMFIAWPNRNHIYLAEAGRSISLWSRLVSQDDFIASPQATEDGFIAVSSSGLVYRINLARQESILWRTNLAAQCQTTPLVADGLILVPTDSGSLIAIDEVNGDRLWLAAEKDVRRALAVTPERVYAQLKAGQLVAIDRKTGRTIARINRPFATGLHNDRNDRILLYTDSGSMISLHEPNAIYPKLNRPAPVTANTKDKSAKKSQPAQGDSNAPAVETEGADPFAGEAMEKSGDAPAATDADPFGTTEDSGAKPSDDPFGGF